MTNVKQSWKDFPKDFFIGDIVELYEIPTLHYMSPRDSIGVFMLIEPVPNGDYLKIKYPLKSKLFNFEPIPFRWVIPNKERIKSRYKILHDPLYTTWYPSKDHKYYREGLGYIVEVPTIKNKDVSDITTIPKIIKTFALDKYYEPTMDIPKNIAITIDHFTGTIVSFLLPRGSQFHSLKQCISSDEVLNYLKDIFKVSYGGADRKLEQEAAHIETLSFVLVKIVNKFGVYLEIPLKIIKHA